MKLNRRQRVGIIVGSTVALLPLLFPVWTVFWTVTGKREIVSQHHTNTRREIKRSSADQNKTQDMRCFLFTGPLEFQLWIPEPRFYNASDDEAWTIYTDTTTYPGISPTSIRGEIHKSRTGLEVAALAALAFLAIFALRDWRK